MIPEGVQIRRMEPEDVPCVVRIEQRAFQTAWTSDMFHREILAEEDSVPLTAMEADRLIGYAVLWVVGPRLHLANIAVEGSERRRGVGTALLLRAFEEAERRGCRRVSLETRVSNRAAISLFRRMGFRTVTISQGYYTDSGEDALVMVRSLTAAGEAGQGRPQAPAAG